MGISEITANGDCSHEIKRHLLLGKKSYDQSVAAVAAKSLQSCPTLCDPIDGSPPGSAVREVFQARVLEWVAIAFSRQIYPAAASAAAAAKSLQSCPTLCDPIDGSPPGSAVPGILQARTLQWVAISFSKITL